MISKIFDKQTGSVKELPLENLDLSSPGLVALPVGPDEIASYAWDGDDLVLALKSGETFVVANFFKVDDDGVHSEPALNGIKYGCAKNAQECAGWTVDAKGRQSSHLLANPFQSFQGVGRPT